MSAPVAQEPASPASVLEFLSTAFAVLGVGCFLYFTSVFVALHEFKEKTISFMGLTFPGSVFNSEAAVHTLTFFCWPLLLLHLLCHLYVKNARQAGRPRPHFPYSLAKLPVVPVQFAWMRVCLFTLLLVWSSFVYCFTCGRVFQKYGMMDNNLLPKTLPQRASESDPTMDDALKPCFAKALRGCQLLTRYPDTLSGQRHDWDSPSWIWINAERYDELRVRPGDPKDTTRVVTTQAIPLWQPWGFLLMSTLLAFSSLWLAAVGLLGKTTIKPMIKTEPEAYEP
jgi:hypothetical protein